MIADGDLIDSKPTGRIVDAFDWNKSMTEQDSAATAKEKFKTNATERWFLCLKIGDCHVEWYQATCAIRT